LEEVWTHLQLLANRHENSCDFFPMVASMFGGCGEQELDDLLGAWLCEVQTQVNHDGCCSLKKAGATSTRRSILQWHAAESQDACDKGFHQTFQQSLQLWHP
jgi:hypothetical protein